MTTRKEILNLPCSVCGQRGAQKACIPCHKSYHDSCVHECCAPSPVPPPPAETGPSPTPIVGPAMSARILKKNPCTKCKETGAQLYCEPCQVSFHLGCGHECPQNEPAPAENDSEAAQPALLGPATPPNDPHCTCGHPAASSGGCGCTNFTCGCGHLWGHGIRLPEKAQHYLKSTSHRTWTLKKPEKPPTTTILSFFGPKRGGVSASSGGSPPQPQAQSAPQPQPHAEPEPPQQPLMEPAIPAVGTCQGYLPEGWTRDFFLLNCPHHVHSSLGEPHRPTISWGVMSGFRGLKHIQCTGLPGWGPCEGLVFNPSLRKILETAVRPALRTPHVCLGFTSIHQKLEDAREQTQYAFFEVSNMRRKIDPLRSKNTHQERVIMAIAQGDVKRAAASLNAAFRRGYGVERLADFMEDAVPANRVHYGPDAIMAAIACFRSSGPQVVRIMYCNGIWPHEKHVARLARAFTFAVGALPSLEGVLDAWANLPPWFITNHMDEIAIVPRLVVGKDSRVEGLCECAGEVYFTCLEDLEEMAKKLTANEWHIATYARVAALSRHAETNYGCVAISATASCNRFKTEAR